MKKKMNYSLIGRAGLVLAVGLLAATDVHARHLEPAEALSILNAGPLKSASANPLKLAYTQEAESGEATLYVFDREDAAGFYVLAADDAVDNIVLGYSHTGSFSQEDMSPSFRWLLDAYSQCVSECAAGGSPMLRVMQANRSDIAPMITTTWNQQAPFNNDCPTLYGNNCVTGCVATAMAQVLNYHKHPTKGTGSHSYTWNGSTLSFDYGSTTFDWANMLDNYSGTSTYTQKAAVAKLMYGCGVSVDMNYSRDGSSASDIRVPYALTKFFNYDKGTRYLKRAFFNYNEWEELIYSEIAASRPVLYSGQTVGNIGHSFICDGYQNGYFHINWGWGGLSDGYFLLSNLDPEVEGVGGGHGSYKYDQSAVVGIQPTVSGSTAWYPIYAGGGISATVFNNGKDAKIFNQGGVYNYSPEAVGIDFILKAVSSTGNEYRGAARHLDFSGMSPNPSGYGSFNLSLPANLANGTYKVYLEFKTPEGNIQPVLFPVTAAAYFNLTVNGKNVTITDGEPEEKATIRVTEFLPESNVAANKSANFILKVNNIGDIDYNGNIIPTLYRYGETTILKQWNLGISIGANLNGTWNVNVPLNSPDGKYTFRVYDMYGDLVSPDFDFWIGENHDGIEAIPADYDNADVYTVSGLLVKKGATPADVNSLGHGIYIIVVNGKAYKIKA